MTWWSEASEHLEELDEEYGEVVDSTASTLLPDTIYFGVSAGGVAADTADDLSQVGTDMTSSSTWVFESAPASRFNVTTEWSVEVVVDCDNTDTGRFFQYDCATAANDMSLRISAGGVIEPILHNTIQPSITLPSIGATNSRYVISWCAEPNPFTTGASDALRWELSAWNLGTGEHTTIIRTFAARGSQTGEFTWWAATSGGSNPFTGVPYACRFGTAFHSTVTTRESFVGHVAAPSLDGELRSDLPVPTRSSGVGDDGHFAGPVHLLAARAARQRDLVLAGPLVNRNYWNLTDYSTGTVAGNITFGLEDPEQAGRYLWSQYLFRRPVPPSCNRVKARLHLQQFRNAVAAQNNLEILLWSMSGPGPLNVPPTSPAVFARQRAGSTFSLDHGAGATAGQWVELGPVDIIRDDRGCTYLALSFWATVGGGGTLTDMRWRIKALVIEPVFSSVNDGVFAGG